MNIADVLDGQTRAQGADFGTEYERQADAVAEGAPDLADALRRVSRSLWPLAVYALSFNVQPDGRSRWTWTSDNPDTFGTVTLVVTPDGTTYVLYR